MKSLAAKIVVAVMVAAAAVIARAQDQQLETTIVDVIARAEPSVVAISRTAKAQPSIVAPQVDDIFGDLREPAAPIDQTETTGAGVIIDPAGLVLTQYLAVREGDAHTVTTVDRRTYAATIQAADPRSGLAVLEIIGSHEASSPRRTGSNRDPDPTFPALPLGNAAELRKGQFIIAIGNPYAIRSDGEPTASWGIVTNFGRRAPPGTNLNDTPGPAGDYRTTLHHLGTLLATDAKLGWNAGGGAVVNLRGELVGLMTTVAEVAGYEQPAGYAIPIDDAIRRIIDMLKQGREVEYGLLGVTFRPTATPDDRIGRSSEGGVTIQQVYPGSPAARAGLQPGDVITQVVGRNVASVDGVQLAIGVLPPGESVTVGYRREGRDASTSARLAKLAVLGKVVVTARPPAWRGVRVDYATAFDTQTLADRINAGAIDAAGCVAVTEVEPQSAAWRAGLRPGMFVSHVGAERVATPEEFRRAAEANQSSVTLRLTQPVRKPDQSEQRDLQIQ